MSVTGVRVISKHDIHTRSNNACTTTSSTYSSELECKKKVPARFFCLVGDDCAVFFSRPGYRLPFTRFVLLNLNVACFSFGRRGLPYGQVYRQYVMLHCVLYHAVCPRAKPT